MNAYILLLVGGVLVAFGVLKIIKIIHLIKHGSVANGVVQDIVSEPNENGGTISYPIISFPVKDKGIVTERYSAGFSFNLYSKGSNVRVIYDPNDYSKFIIDSLLIKVLCYILIVAGGVIFAAGIFKMFN